MDRRTFNGTLFGAGILTVASANLATARVREDEREFPALGRVRIQLDGQTRSARYLIIQSPEDAIEIPLDRDYPLTNENRSSILNPTLARRYKNGLQIGDVRWDGTDVLTTIDRPLEIEGLHITDQEISYRINAENVAQPRPITPIPKNQPIIGAAMIRGTQDRFSNELVLFFRRKILIEQAIEGL